ncbi:MAG: ATP-binding cassette domain-containing protein [Gammaproteobacteria bacterium]|nr:ATP-binding cassette domain-containing protein [Gammaproteobacteria bacterium]
MIILDDISLQRAGKFLFKDSSVTINKGQHLGVTGANGTGKTSLFKLLLGELSIDTGELHIPARLTISHMAQELEASDLSAVEFVIDGDATLRQLETQLKEAEIRHDDVMIGKLHESLQDIDGYNAHYRAEQLLHGLGFSQSDCERQVNEFSGGWRIRLNLARVLMCPGDLLLLDEPTNHLDLDATIWLENWLKRFPGTLMLISHDRDFLDAVVQHILHLEHQSFKLYRGNYSAFENQRAESLAQQQALYEKQQQRVREIERFVNRFRAKATKARQAQSRLKELDRMQNIAAAHVDSPFSFTIPQAPKLSDPLLTLSQVSVGYDESAILSQLKFSLHPGSCIGLLGVNGAGKSTLIKTLLGEPILLEGERTEGEHLRIGYFAQHQLEALDMEASPLLHLQRLSPEASEQEIRNYLGGFNFHGDKALDAVRPFSGGEKARLALAIVAWQKPNLLLLDEPTNHLDLEMRHALTMALQEYQGAMLIVSHDRHLLRNCVSEFWLVANGRVDIFDGNLEDYQKNFVHDKARTELEVKSDSKPNDARATRQKSAALRAELSPLKNRLKKLEKEISEHQVLLKVLEEKLADSKMYQEEFKEDLQRMLKESGNVKQKLFKCEDEWLNCQEKIEVIEGSG